MFSIKKKATQTAKRAGLLTVGGILCAIGVGFFTLAAWLYLLTVVSALQAALIIGAGYFGIGLIMIGLGTKKPHQPEPLRDPETARQPDVPPLLQALLFGIEAGSKVSGKRKN
ncbi:MAG: phage holin family protein [Sulfitobacter sp.]